jgi:colanic acid biosynthesis glycosyl transferase WcaI
MEGLAKFGLQPLVPARTTVRILIVGINYTPEQTGIGPYTAGLAEHLAAQGHAVDVLTGLPSYPEWKVHKSFRRVFWQSAQLNGVLVHRRWHYVPRAHNALRRLTYEASFLLTGLSLVLLPKPTLVVGVVPTLSGGVLAVIAARRFNVPYTLIFQDLMGPAATQAGLSGGERVASSVRAVERRLALGAGTLAIIADSFRPYLESLGVEAHRIHRIRNWTRLSEPTEDRKTTREKLGIQLDRIVCLHAGNMGHKQALENVIESARIAEAKAPELHFILMGDGNRKGELMRLADKYRLGNLSFLPLQPDQSFCNILAAADILLLNQLPGVSDMALPSKLTAYLAAGRPIVAAVEAKSETANEVLQARGGLVIEPGRPDLLLAALINLAVDNEMREQMGRHGQKHASSNFSYSAALERIEALLAGSR